MSARDNNPTRTGPRRRVGAGAAGRRDRLQGRERQAVHVAKELVEQLERTVPGMVHSLRLDTFNKHLRVDIVLNRNRHSGSGAGEGSAGDDAGPPAGGPEDAPRPRQQRRGSTAGTAAQPTRGRRQLPPLPPTGQQQQQPQPSAAPTTAPPSPRPAADASPAQTANMGRRSPLPHRRGRSPQPPRPRKRARRSATRRPPVVVSPERRRPPWAGLLHTYAMGCVPSRL